MHQVNPGHKFRYRMIRRQTRIHFKKVEVPLRIQQKFDGSHIRVSSCLNQADRRLTHPRSQLFIDNR